MKEAVKTLINIHQLTDYLYCPELWSKNREKSHLNLDRTSILERLDKRKKRIQKFTELKKKFFMNKQVRKNYRQPENLLLSISLVLGIPLLIHLFAQTFYLSIPIFFFLLILWTVKVVRKKLYLWIDQQTDPYHLILEEKKINPDLQLIDPELQVYGAIPDVKLDKGKIVVRLDRSHKTLPSFFLHSFKSDILFLAIYLHMLKVNFFIPEKKLVGEIHYKNRKKNLRIYYGKQSKFLEKEVKKFIKNNQIKTLDVFTGSPFRCIQCTYQQDCTKSQIYPRLKTKSSKDENVEQSYQDFVKNASKLLNTNWGHWKDDVRNLMQSLRKSTLIQKKLSQINRNSEKYDMKEIVESAIFHNRRLANTYLASTKKELAFCYQLLLYLEKNGTLKEMKPLINAYGLYQGQDTKTSLDIKIARFFQVTLRNFIESIDEYLVTHVPDDKITHIQNTFKNFGGQMNIGFDESTIHAEMNVLEEEDEDEEDGEDEELARQ